MTLRNRNIVTFEVSDETAALWNAVKKHPKTKRGFQTDVLRRLLDNFLSDFEVNGLLSLDDDLRYKFERFESHHTAKKGRLFQIEAQRQIYWNAMTAAFRQTNIPILFAKHEFSILDMYVEMIRSRVFEESEGELSVPKSLVNEFVRDAIQELEATGELNKLRCKEQLKEYGEDELPMAKAEN